MSQTELPIESLPIWSRFNGVKFDGVGISQIEGKGFGLVAERSFEAISDESTPVHRILSVPAGLVLNAEAVEEHAKEDQRFRELLDAAGRQSSRGDVLLFLLAQLVLVWKSGGKSGLSNPWTQYIKYLPRAVPLPTLWTEAERLLLNGTSLETAVQAKLLALEREFYELKEKSSVSATWKEILWESEPITLRDWVVLDAWYRSRCLELPRKGSSMVPCVDMVNHSRRWTAFYTLGPDGGVELCLDRGSEVAVGAEITISYGDAKAPAEMLFSYGFVDPEGSQEKIVLPVDVPEDDPLARAKVHIFGETPTIEIAQSEDGSVDWQCPFAYLLALNEEDGMGLRVLQLTDGSRQMRLFWEGDDVTDLARDLKTVTGSHAHHAVFRLRAVVLVQQQLEAQEQRISAPPAESDDPRITQDPPAVRPGCREAASRLRVAETKMLRGAIGALELEKSQLLEDEAVKAYLGSMEVSEDDLAPEAPTNEEDDFS